MPCGIGLYAAQQVETLRGQGAVVDVFSPPGGEGDREAVFDDGLLPLRLLRRAWAYDELFIHFTPAFFYRDGSAARRWLTSLSFLVLALVAARRLNFIIHETERSPGGGASRGVRSWLDRLWWRRARRVIFHSARERDAFAARYRIEPDRPNIEIWPHEAFFVRRCALDRDSARLRLGIEPGTLLLLSIGFIQPHKGFDRVIEAFAHVARADLRYKVVGSVRIDWDVAHRYARRLHELAARDPRCEIVETWLDDELFDAWLIAADYVVVPYREIWSSGVAARARLYDRPLIAANAGALPEQGGAGSFFFDDENQLAEILRGLTPLAPRSARRSA